MDLPVFIPEEMVYPPTITNTFTNHHATRFPSSSSCSSTMAYSSSTHQQFNSSSWKRKRSYESAFPISYNTSITPPQRPLPSPSPATYSQLCRLPEAWNHNFIIQAKVSVVMKELHQHLKYDYISEPLLRFYAANVVGKSCVSGREFIIALAYLNRVASALRNPDQVKSSMMPNFFLTEPHVFASLFLTCLMLATKFSMETNECMTNAVWARLGGMTLQQVNATERFVLNLLDFKLHVKDNEWQIWTSLYHGVRPDNLVNSTSTCANAATTAAAQLSSLDQVARSAPLLPQRILRAIFSRLLRSMTEVGLLLSNPCDPVLVHQMRQELTPPPTPPPSRPCSPFEYENELHQLPYGTTVVFPTPSSPASQQQHYLYQQQPHPSFLSSNKRVCLNRSSSSTTTTNDGDGLNAISGSGGHATPRYYLRKCN